MRWEEKEGNEGSEVGRSPLWAEARSVRATERVWSTPDTPWGAGSLGLQTPAAVALGGCRTCPLCGQSMALGPENPQEDMQEALGMWGGLQGTDGVGQVLMMAAVPPGRLQEGDVIMEGNTEPLSVATGVQEVASSRVGLTESRLPGLLVRAGLDRDLRCLTGP